MKNPILNFNSDNTTNDASKLQYSNDNSLGMNCESCYAEHALGCKVELGLGMSILTPGTWPMLAATITIPLRIQGRFTPMSTIRRRTRTPTTVLASSLLNPIHGWYFSFSRRINTTIKYRIFTFSFFSRNFFHRFYEIKKKLVNDFCILQPYRLSSIKIARLEVG